MTTGERNLDWDGLYNARDLGGLPIASGGSTRRRSLVRTDGLSRLTPHGWDALHRYGVQTCIDLRSSWEVAERCWRFCSCPWLGCPTTWSWPTTSLPTPDARLLATGIGQGHVPLDGEALLYAGRGVTAEATVTDLLAGLDATRRRPAARRRAGAR